MPELSQSIIDPANISIDSFLICAAASAIFGTATALMHMRQGGYNKNFVITIATLPLIVQIVIMLVNGNIGAGIAVAGAFSLVRFRSIPGSSRDIASVFMSMALGFVTGMGYIFYGIVFVILIALFGFILRKSNFGGKDENKRALKITIPENLDYDGLFDDILTEYADKYELIKVKTSNMGSLYDLTYQVVMKSPNIPKTFIDGIRCRNGNLNVMLSREMTDDSQL